MRLSSFKVGDGVVNANTGRLSFEQSYLLELDDWSGYYIITIPI